MRQHLDIQTVHEFKLIVLYCLTNVQNISTETAKDKPHILNMKNFKPQSIKLQFFLKQINFIKYTCIKFKQIQANMMLTKLSIKLISLDFI